MYDFSPNAPLGFRNFFSYELDLILGNEISFFLLSISLLFWNKSLLIWPIFLPKACEMIPSPLFFFD